MILGIGIDIVEVDRIKKLCLRYKERFLTRIYTEKELDYCMNKANRYECLSGRFAAKEAVVKATGGRIRVYKEIEILNSSRGPLVNIIEDDAYKIHVSISHIEKLAISLAIWEG